MQKCLICGARATIMRRGFTADGHIEGKDENGATVLYEKFKPAPESSWYCGRHAPPKAAEAAMTKETR